MPTYTELLAGVAQLQRRVLLHPSQRQAVEEQATARAHRIGQDQPGFVYKLAVQGSIEDRMLALQARKAALAEGALGTTCWAM